MRPTIFLLLAFYLISCTLAEDEYEYEDEPAAPVVTQAPAKPASRLGSLLSPRGRAPIGRKTSSTTTTTSKPVEQVVEEETELDDEVVDENAEQEDIPTTTTEASKKLRAGGIMRSFRTNEDLLAALKRRRAQAGTHRETSTHSSVEASTPKSNRSLSGRNKSNSNSESSTRPGTRGRFGSNSRGKVQEQTEETQQDEVQVKSKPYHRG